MTAASREMPRTFKRAVLFSILLHAGLIIVIAASPSLPKPQKKGLIQYVNLVSFPGGGGSGGAGGGEAAAPKAQPLPPPKAKETLKDLTVPEKAKAEDKAGLRHPVDKPKTAKKAPEKKAAITKPQPSAATGAEAAAPAAAGTQGSGTGAGYGLRFGTAAAGGGTGSGTGGGTGGEPFGVSGFPFTYYLQFLSDKISASWFTSLVDPGVSGQFQTQVYFKIYRNGQVADLKVEVSSGVPSFDLSALRAIQTASPFAPLPSEYDGQYLGIHLIFEHSR